MHFNTPLVNEAPKNTDEGEDYETHNAIHVQNIFNTCPLEYLGIFLHSPRLRGASKLKNVPKSSKSP